MRIVITIRTGGGPQAATRRAAVAALLPHSRGLTSSHQNLAQIYAFCQAKSINLCNSMLFAKQEA